MNEFTAKKLAEVTAFARLSDDIVNRTNPTFADAMPDIADRLANIAAPVLPIGDHQSVFIEKTEKTIAKLMRMMELYIADQWSDPVEVLEWLSFYAGAASAHADLAVGALRKLELTVEADSVEVLSREFWTVLELTKDKLVSVGARRATE